MEAPSPVTWLWQHLPPWLLCCVLPLSSLHLTAVTMLPSETAAIYTVAPPLKHLTAHLSPHSGRAEVLTLICRPVRTVLSYFSDYITYFPSLLFSPLHSGRPPRSSDTSASGPVLFPLPPLARCLHLESLFLHVSLSNSFPKVS